MTTEKVILLLGRRDQPTDGVADYCEKLREAGLPRGLAFEPVQLLWAENGWRSALEELRRAAAGWHDRWVLLQFTTLAWSRRGFPLRAPRVLDVILQSGARPGIVLHDFSPLAGSGIVARARAYCQLRVFRQLYARSELAIFTVPFEKIAWLPASQRDKAFFVPVGANCPEALPDLRDESSKPSTVAVYSVTGGDRMLTEISDLTTALRRASKTAGPIRLLLFGRGSKKTEPALRSELVGTDVQIESLGILAPEKVSHILAGADVLLFVRGQISSRRGSAIAGIACGLPVVCYSGPETSWPITEAGIQAVPLGDKEALAGALETVLVDGDLRKALAERSRWAHEKYFSWAAITERFAAALGAIRREKENGSKKKLSNPMRVV